MHVLKNECTENQLEEKNKNTKEAFPDQKANSEISGFLSQLKISYF